MDCVKCEFRFDGYQYDGKNLCRNCTIEMIADNLNEKDKAKYEEITNKLYELQQDLASIEEINAERRNEAVLYNADCVSVINNHNIIKKIKELDEELDNLINVEQYRLNVQQRNKIYDEQGVEDVPF